MLKQLLGLLTAKPRAESDEEGQMGGDEHVEDDINETIEVGEHTNNKLPTQDFRILSRKIKQAKLIVVQNTDRAAPNISLNAHGCVSFVSCGWRQLWVHITALRSGLRRIHCILSNHAWIHH